ncbi:MAG: hypothetical protein ACOH1K_01145 [Rhodoglobus sp.]
MDAATTPRPTMVLQPLGDPAGDSCSGDACLIVDHSTQAIVNRRIDEGLI